MAPVASPGTRTGLGVAALTPPPVPLLAWDMPFWRRRRCNPLPPSPEQVPAETQHARDRPLSPQAAGGLCCSPAPLPSATTSSTSSSQPVAANLSPKVTAAGSPHSPQDRRGGLDGGSRLSLPAGFKRKETRGKLAIGITTNFINRHSRAEVEVAEISGVARIYNQKFFQNLYNKTGRWSRPRCGGRTGVPIPPDATGGSALGCPLCDGTRVPLWYPIAGDMWWLSPVRGLPMAPALPRGSAQPLPHHQASTWKTSSTTRTTLTISS